MLGLEREREGEGGRGREGGETETERQRQTDRQTEDKLTDENEVPLLSSAFRFLPATHLKWNIIYLCIKKDKILLYCSAKGNLL